MLQELAAASSAQAWAIGSLLFFFVLFLAITVRVLSRQPEAYGTLARLPLDEPESRPDLGNDRQKEASRD